MELVNKVLQGYVDGELKNIAPSTRQDNVFLSTNQEKTIEDSLISVYTHTRSGTVNEFTGTGPNGKALMTADIEEGDTFTVNGQPVTAYIGSENAIDVMAGSPWNGKWISFTFDGTQINFNGGGGLSAADKEKLIPENIREGITIAGVTGTLTWENLLPEVIAAQDGDVINEILGGLTAGAGINLSSNGINAQLSSSSAGWRFNNPIDGNVFQAVRFHYTGSYRRNDGYTTFGVGNQNTNESGFTVSQRITDYPGSGSVQINLPESDTLFVRAYIFASTMLVTKTELVKRQ